ncbi:MAG: hypothetical protein ACKO37_06960 [Vampirovibrionales bacterium]
MQSITPPNTAVKRPTVQSSCASQEVSTPTGNPSTGFDPKKLLAEFRAKQQSLGPSTLPPQCFLETPIAPSNSNPLQGSEVKTSNTVIPLSLTEEPSSAQVNPELMSNKPVNPGTPTTDLKRFLGNKTGDPTKSATKTNGMKEKYPVNNQPPDLYGKGADGKPIQVQLPKGATVSEDKRTLTTASGNTYTLGDDGTMILTDKEGQIQGTFLPHFNHPARNFLDRNVPQPPTKPYRLEGHDMGVSGIKVTPDGSLQMSGLVQFSRLGGTRTLSSNDPVSEFFPEGSIKRDTSEEF